MNPVPDISTIASAIGEPARARMLAALMDGRALTATELALEAGVTPSTASSHLSRLRREGLITLATQGRHRYFRIATSTIAGILESLMGLVASPIETGPRDAALRRARVCYDHLAGAEGVALLDRLRERGLLRDDGGALAITPAGDAWLRRLGVDVAKLVQRSRPLVRACLDWSERRDHLAGAVGAAILTRLFELRLLRRELPGRSLTMSTRGESFLESLEIPRR
jgi:DNA-binding transcriptional ArsR family regulator